MRTYCTACKQEGYIAPQGPRWPGTGTNGQQWALSGDINICGCTPPPVFYAERSMKMIFTSDELHRLTTASASSAATETVASNTFDRHFRITNQHTGKPLAGIPYRIVTDDGEEYEGRTDLQGHTLRVSSDWDISATLHVIENETPINPDWDRYL
jgi:hypothetical protein